LGSFHASFSDNLLKDKSGQIPGEKKCPGFQGETSKFVKDFGDDPG
jgi:hypothetical protein